MIDLNQNCKLVSTSETYAKWGYDGSAVDGNNVKPATYIPTAPVHELAEFERDTAGQYRAWGLVHNGPGYLTIPDLEGAIHPGNDEQPHGLHMAGCRGVSLEGGAWWGAGWTHGHYCISVNDCHDMQFNGLGLSNAHVGIQLAGCRHVHLEDVTGVQMERGTVSIHEGYCEDILLDRVSGRVVIGNLTWRTSGRWIRLRDCDLEFLTIYGDFAGVIIEGGQIQRTVQLVSVNEDSPLSVVFGGVSLGEGVKFASFRSHRGRFAQVEDSGWWKTAHVQFRDCRSSHGGGTYVFAESPGERTWQQNNVSTMIVAGVD